MKTYKKIFIIIIISSLVVFSSCKKDELIIEGCTETTALNYNSTATSNDGTCCYVAGCMDSIMYNYNTLACYDDGSCIPITYGCTDTSAMNYLLNATSNDGSCIYAYDIAQGIWNISSVCDDLTISIPLVGDFPVPLDDIFPPTIEITGEGNDVVSLDVNGNDVMADVSNEGMVTIKDNQTISFDTGIPLIGILDVNVSGSGQIETETNGHLTLNLAFEIPLAGTQTSSCEITFTK